MGTNTSGDERDRLSADDEPSPRAQRVGRALAAILGGAGVLLGLGITGLGCLFGSERDAGWGPNFGSIALPMIAVGLLLTVGGGAVVSAARRPSPSDEGE